MKIESVFNSKVPTRRVSKYPTLRKDGFCCTFLWGVVLQRTTRLLSKFETVSFIHRLRFKVCFWSTGCIGFLQLASLSRLHEKFGMGAQFSARIPCLRFLMCTCIRQDQVYPPEQSQTLGQRSHRPPKQVLVVLCDHPPQESALKKPSSTVAAKEKIRSGSCFPNYQANSPGLWATQTSIFCTQALIQPAPENKPLLSTVFTSWHVQPMLSQPRKPAMFPEAQKPELKPSHHFQNTPPLSIQKMTGRIFDPDFHVDGWQ